MGIYRADKHFGKLAPGQGKDLWGQIDHALQLSGDLEIFMNEGRWQALFICHHRFTEATREIDRDRSS